MLFTLRRASQCPFSFSYFTATSDKCGWPIAWKRKCKVCIFYSHCYYHHPPPLHFLQWKWLHDSGGLSCWAPHKSLNPASRTPREVIGSELVRWPYWLSPPWRPEASNQGSSQRKMVQFEGQNDNCNELKHVKSFLNP